ncbi:MAG: hypothetical protein CM15mP55_1600 [Hyphomicrobiales bacterium]|nr:MAG: hypothetical protein CM15mP55_1600 [Hyphomicrobiales bacterium]
MAAFCSVGSDLDARQLSNCCAGVKTLFRLLKQAQFSPLKVEEQVVVIYAGVNGYLDVVQTSDVGRFEQGLWKPCTPSTPGSGAIRAGAV